MQKDRHELFFMQFLCTLNAKEEEMVEECSMHRENEMFTKFCLVGLNGRDHFEDLGIDEVIQIYVKERCEWEALDWIHLAQEKK
jgi:hypothetical protein